MVDTMFQTPTHEPTSGLTYGDDPYEQQLDFLRPIVTGWLSKIEIAKKSRKEWKAMADECMLFFSASTGFMWDNRNKAKFWEGTAAPRFRLTIAKAFEMVALYGPSLFYNAPHRTVQPKKLAELPPGIFGDLSINEETQQPNDPQAFMLYQQAMMEQSTQRDTDVARANLMETWLNYTPSETPNGGLEWHAQMAVTEALVKGRGVLWPEVFQYPGSGKMLTGLFYDSVDNLLIDPDATSFHEARWIARQVTAPIWEIEERFDLPTDSLKKKSTLESAWSLGERSGNPGSANKRQTGETFDTMTYYQVYSMGGPGSRLTNVHVDIKDHLEEVVGKNAYIVVAPGVPYPLNAPSSSLRSGATDEAVRDFFSWPIPFWADDKFPCCVLDFYPKPGSAWPIPPLAPGMGELKFLNVMISHLCNRIWSSSRDFIAVLKSASEEIKKQIREGDDLCILDISEVHKDIGQVIQFLQQPQVNFDVWRIIDRVSEMFDRRTGLTDLVYGISDTQSRSAEDASTKRQGISIRPDYMAKQVEKWMATLSGMEAFATRWFISAEDVQPIMGNVGAQVWSALVDEEDIEKVVREYDYDVAPSSARRPNKDRDIANINQALQFFFPEFSKHADMTTDTSALNELIKRWGDTTDMDMTGIQLGDRVPPPPPEPPPGMDPVEVEQMQLQHELMLDQEKHDQEMIQDADEHDQDMEQKSAMGNLERLLKRRQVSTNGKS